MNSISIPPFPLADADSCASGSLAGNDLLSSPLRFFDCSFSLCQTLNPSSWANITEEDLKEAPASRPPPDDAVSLGLVMPCVLRSAGIQLKLLVDHQRAVLHQERQQVSFVEALRRGLVTTGVGCLGDGAAPLFIRSITNADRRDAPGIITCSEEVVGSSKSSSSLKPVLPLPKGGDSGPCSNLQHPEDSAAIAFPPANVRVDSAEGFVLKSILKKIE
ncbi:hypothetical protein Nepgr_030923 [Nepenthes gracilis]|uniref:Uncharacterized protein n=1 Tax=Nepenthes gracilis TaxID=150966 RepID=A0AAD3TGC3_NEPGR|nr:hypothetical protein Nepgr_030923 [Nepenthes gracilis]